MTSCNITLSSDKSATIFFSRAFSCSGSRSCFISEGMSPAYFFFQLNYVAELIPTFLQTSATGVPSSAYFMMNAFCASVNFDAFMRIRSSPSQRFDAENSKQDRGRYRGSHQAQRDQLMWMSVSRVSLHVAACRFLLMRAGAVFLVRC